MTSVLDLMKPTVIIIESGSIVDLPWLGHANKNQATVWAGYGGLRGGAALGRLIFAATARTSRARCPWLGRRRQSSTSYRSRGRRLEAGTQMGLLLWLSRVRSPESGRRDS